MNKLQKDIRSGLLHSSDLYKLTVEQLRSLKLSNLPKSAIEHIFLSDSGSTITAEEKLKLFSPADIKLAIEKNLLPIYFLKLISDEQLIGLKLSNLSKEMINCLFFSWWGEDNKDYRAQRFSYFSAEDVQEAILLGLLDNSLLLSDEHLKKLEISKLSKATINNLFFYNRERFAKISVSEVKKAYVMGLLADQLYLISDKQKKKIGNEFFKRNPSQYKFLCKISI